MVRNKKYYLGMYEKAVPVSFTLEEKLIACKQCGFDWMEISIDETDEKISRLYWNKDQKDELKKSVMKIGQPIWTMCFSALRKYSLGSIDEEREKKAMEIVRLAIDFASDIGIRIIQMAGYDTYYEQSCELSKEKFSRNLKKAVEMASAKGVILAFETQMDRDFIDTVEKAMVHVNNMQSPYLKVYPDIGNMEAAIVDFGYTHTVVDDLEKGRGNIVAAHLKETTPKKDRNNPWGQGLTKYEEDIAKLKELGVRMFNGEFWCTDEIRWKESCLEANKFLRSKLDKVFE